MLRSRNSKTTAKFECNICYSERPTDMMVKLCNKNKVTVCNCTISICRICSDQMQQKSCPTCRTNFNQVVNLHEATEKNISISSIQPSHVTLQQSCRLSICEDKPIMLDYWIDSLNKKALIGVRESGEKLLVKSPEEYTSSIIKMYKCEKEYIMITINTIYIVSSDISVKRVC